MVLSCLVEPLVSPLIGGTSGTRRSSLAGSGLASSRLATTALACTALAALSGMNLPEALASRQAKTTPAMTREVERKPEIRNAHQRPAPVPYRQLLTTVFATPARPEDELHAPGEAPRFEQGMLDVHRLRHKRDIIRETGPCLGLAQRLDRLTGGLLQTFLRFGSGRHLAGQPVA